MREITHLKISIYRIHLFLPIALEEKIFQVTRIAVCDPGNEQTTSNEIQSVSNKMETGMNIKAKVRKFILDELLETDTDDAIGDDDSLIESAVIDSMSILQLISFMDEEFDVLPEDGVMKSEDISTINQIVKFIERMLQG